MKVRRQERDAMEHRSHPPVHGVGRAPSSVNSCAGRVAQEFGDHPEAAAARMRWARAAVAVLDSQLVPAMRWIVAA